MLYWLLSALCLGFSQASAMLCSGLVIVTKVGHPSSAPTGFSTHQCRPPQLVDSFVHHVISSRVMIMSLGLVLVVTLLHFRGGAFTASISSCAVLCFFLHPKLL